MSEPFLVMQTAIFFHIKSPFASLGNGSLTLARLGALGGERELVLQIYARYIGDRTCSIRTDVRPYIYGKKSPFAMARSRSPDDVIPMLTQTSLYSQCGGLVFYFQIYSVTLLNLLRACTIYQ